ncbi:melatonin receptor type 1C-like [Protopterus annectens]|uniref:melatonin receptor type 1C-like n=1 Tax=Protopterus annectens TaxID=7888 RepID=UPI001CFC0FB4|nr:melatonin receptor type 1C-like [Protopterus annectens]
MNCSDCWLINANHTGLPATSSSAAKTISLTIVLLFIIVADLIGNTLVILSVLRNRKLRNAGNVFVISLSVADLMVAVYPYPLILTAVLNDGWIVGNTHCQVSGIILNISLLASVYNILAIAINRYFYICHRSKYDKIYSTQNTILWLCFIWALTVAALMPIVAVGALRYVEQIFSCTFTQSVNPSSDITVAFIHFIIPMAIIIYCYARIWILVIKVKYRVRKDGKQKLKSAEIKSFLSMFIVFVLFTICWAPFSINSLGMGFSPPGKAPNFPSWLFVMSYFSTFFNSCINGIVYGVFNQNFRQEYKNIILLLWLPRLFCKKTSRGGSKALPSKTSLVMTSFRTFSLPTTDWSLYQLLEIDSGEGTMKCYQVAKQRQKDKEKVIRHSLLWMPATTCSPVHMISKAE